MKRTQSTAPDAWMVLVLSTMSTAEIVEALREESDPQKSQWLADELKKRVATS